MAYLAEVRPVAVPGIDFKCALRALCRRPGFAVAAVLTIALALGANSASVAGRSREFGIRATTGAGPFDLMRLVLASGSIVCLIGLAAGLLLNTLASRLIQSVLFGVSTGDPLTLAAAAVAVLAMCLISILIQARRAASADPAVVLRGE